MAVGGAFSGGCGCGPDIAACESPTQPVATVGVCLADGTPIAVTVVRDCVGTVTSEGWINLTTGAYSAGAPPVGTMACGDSRSITTTGTFCDVAEDGAVLGLVLVEYQYAADGSISSVRLVDAVTGDTYTPTGTVTTCPAGVAHPERDMLQLCDTNDDESGTVLTVSFLRDFARDETGAVVGHSDYTLDGEPYTPSGTVGVCPAESECRNCQTFTLCDTPADATPAPVLASGTGAQTGTAANGVGWSTSSGTSSSVPDWFPLSMFPVTAGGPFVLTLDRPSAVIWSARVGTNGTAVGRLIMPPGSELVALSPLHVYDASTRTLSPVPGAGTADGNGESTFTHLGPVTSLTIESDGTTGLNISQRSVGAFLLTPATVPFLRTTCRDCTGLVLDATDTLLDGTTPYTPIGTVGVCQPQQAEPCRDTATLLLCDEASDLVWNQISVDADPDSPAGQGWLFRLSPNDAPSTIATVRVTTSTPDTGSCASNGPRWYNNGTVFVYELDEVAQTFPTLRVNVLDFDTGETLTMLEGSPDRLEGNAYTTGGGVIRSNENNATGYLLFDGPPATFSYRFNGSCTNIAFDAVSARTTQFIRRIVTDCDTDETVSVTDTDLQGQPYTPTGEVGQCEPVAECCEQAPPEQRVDVETELLCIRDAESGDVLGQVVVERVYDDQSGDRLEQRLTDPTTGAVVELPAGAVLARCPSPDRITRQICVVESGAAEFLTNAANATSGQDTDWQWSPVLGGSWYPMYRVAPNPLWTVQDTAPNQAHWVSPHASKSVCSPNTAASPNVTGTWFTRASWNLPANVSPDSIRIAASVLNADNRVVQWRLNDGPWQPVAGGELDPPAWTITPSAVPGGRAGQNEIVVQITETQPAVNCPSPNQAGMILHVAATYDYEPRVWTQVIEDGRVYYLDETGARQDAIPEGQRVVACGGSGGECCPQEPACPVAFSTECVGAVSRTEASYDNTSLIGGVPGQCGSVQGPGGQFPCQPTTGPLTITSWVVNGEETIGEGGGRAFNGGPCGAGTAAAPGMHLNWSQALTNLDPTGAVWSVKSEPACAFFVGSTGGTQTVYGSMTVQDAAGQQWILGPAQACEETQYTKVYTQECDGTVSVSWLDPQGVETDAPEGDLVPCGTGCGSGGGRGLDVETLALCDVTADGTIVPFLRHLTYGSGGQVTLVVDTMLDGVAPYTPAGDIGVCDRDRPVTVLEECRCDDSDGDGVADTDYVELIAVARDGTLSTLGTYTDDLTGPYVPVAPVECGTAGADPALGVRAHRIEVAPGGSWSAAGVPLLQAVTMTAHGADATVTTEDGTSVLHVAESVSWSVARDLEAALVGPLTVTAAAGTVTVAYTRTVTL